MDAALAATAGRFAQENVLAIVRHHAADASTAELVIADKTHCAQPATTA